MIYIGIDCSKATFDVAIPQAKGYQTHKLANREEGFKNLLELLPEDSLCLMEADPKCMAFGQQVQWTLFLQTSYFSLSPPDSCLSSKSISHQTFCSNAVSQSKNRQSRCLGI